MADQRRPRSKSSSSSSTSPEVAIVEGILKGIGAILGLFFEAFRSGSSGSKTSRVGKAQIQEGWDRVEMHLVQEATAALAVSEGDKLLDAAFQYSGIKGATMGERLKNAAHRLPEDLYQSVWDAHKLRNTLAHEVGAHVSMNSARTAVSAFRSALYHLKVL
jgi:hypothetical protein